MKKAVFLYLFLLVLLITCSKIENEWTNDSRILSSYDSDGKLISIIEQDWKDEEWLNREKLNYTYDKNDKEIETLTLYWFEGEWKNDKLDKTEYDSANKIFSKIEFGWRYDRWIEVFKRVYSYDDKLKRRVISHFRNMDNEWVETTKSFRYYDDFGNEIESWSQSRKSYYAEQGELHYTDGLEDVRSKWVNKIDSAGNIIENQYQYVKEGNFKIIARTKFDFNSENQIISQLKQERDNDTLVNVNKTEISYNNFGKEEEVLSSWGNGDWAKSNRHTFIYDENGLLTEMAYNVWENNDWQNSFRTIYKYDKDSNEMERLVQEYKK
ncbi:MAG: hypothetical protein HKM87_03700 [Ignavibacteriaceae bacterium]|nr:hypothetical protein [Ignavibacteriaceae bacterium]